MTPDIPPGCARCKKLADGIVKSNRIAARLQERLTKAAKTNQHLIEENRRLKAAHEGRTP